MQHLWGVMNDFEQICSFLSVQTPPKSFSRPPSVPTKGSLPPACQGHCRSEGMGCRGGSLCHSQAYSPQTSPTLPIYISFRLLDAAGARYITVKWRRIPTEKPATVEPPLLGSLLPVPHGLVPGLHGPYTFFCTQGMRRL